MSRCRPERHVAALRARDELEAEPGVIVAELVPDRLTETDRPTIEVLVPLSGGGAPPALLDTLAEYGLTARHVHRGGDAWRVVATA